MKIDLSKVPTLWYENEGGECWVPSEEEVVGLAGPPEGFVFMRMRDPTNLRESHFRIDAYGDGRGKEFMSVDKSWSEDLVLAMVTRPWWMFWRRVYSLSEAILIAANACERCGNVLRHQYGLGGYAEGSQDCQDCGTSCCFCEDE